MAAYNSYYPMTYNPYCQPYYQPYIQQPMQNTTQTTQTPSTSGIIWVSGLQEAQMYPLAPNNAVALWEQSGKVIYLKSSDATGKPNMRIYDLIERADTGLGSASVDGKTDYATRDELGAVTGTIKSVLNDIEQMKADLYGVAGRKKPSKKVESEDDDA